ncbi:MAG TPA: PepSY-associated TM helix domain-containing protein [Allosphingosinicella sp.]
MTRRSWFRWHSWIGLTTGLLLFVVCWSGTIAVFSREIDLALDPGVTAAPRTERIAWGAAARNLGQAHPDWWVYQITASHGPGTTVEAWALDGEGVSHRILADPASGGLLGTRSMFGVQRFFRSFHMALFIEAWPILGVPLGDWIVALLAIPLLASLVTSLVFYRRFWRGFFKLERAKGRKVFWSDVHKLTGLWSLWFLLAIGLTGLWYLGERHLPEGPAPPRAAPVKNARLLPVADLVARAGAAFPELRINAIILNDYEAGQIELHGQDGALLVRDRAARLWLDSRSGKALRVQRSSDLAAYERWIDTADPVHFGNFAGLWSKVPWFVFGLALSGLCLSGAYLQAKRQERRPGGGYRGPVLAAYAVTVACLLLAARFGYEEIASYGNGGAWPEVPAGVTAFIAAWTAATLGILTLWMRWVR